MASRAYIECEPVGKKTARATPKSPPRPPTKPYSGEGQKKTPHGVLYTTHVNETQGCSFRAQRHQLEHKSYASQFRAPKESKVAELGKWSPLSKALRGTKSDARYVRRAYTRLFRTRNPRRTRRRVSKAY